MHTSQNWTCLLLSCLDHVRCEVIEGDCKQLSIEFRNTFSFYHDTSNRTYPMCPNKVTDSDIPARYLDACDSGYENEQQMLQLCLCQLQLQDVSSVNTSIAGQAMPPPDCKGVAKFLTRGQRYI